MQAGKRKRAENDHRGSKRTKAAPMEATNQAAMTKAPAKRTIGRGEVLPLDPDEWSTDKHCMP